jgi:aspartate racemase
MKTIGLVGGTGWISTVEYYRIINEETNRRLGEMDFARCVLYSVNFGDIQRFNEKHETEGIFSLMLSASKKLETVGIDCILRCANTVHTHADRVGKGISAPLIHIAKATAARIGKRYQHGWTARDAAHDGTRFLYEEAHRAENHHNCPR